MVITETRRSHAPVTSGLTQVIGDLLGTDGHDLPIRIACYDGGSLGPPDATTTLVVRSDDALRYIITAPGELGFARAYVSGALDVEGDIFEALALRDFLPDVHVSAKEWAALARLVGRTGLRPPPRPAEEARLHGRRHTPERDAAAIAHHYDVGNDFYRLVLGPAMTYSCAVWSDAATTLEAAQTNKYDLICRKLGLRPGMRLLDIGCGWGGMAIHAARNYGVDAVGITLSHEQVEHARRAALEAGLSDRLEFRLQDYRALRDAPFDAISSIGMFEHVGRARLHEYFADVYGLLRPQGRFLNHAISRPPGNGRRAHFARQGFIDRYVFPDGELHEVGTVVSAIQQHGFEARHVETLREHYARTLRAWVTNLERDWDTAVALTSAGRARVWRLYMAASAMNFEAGRTQVHQVLAVRADGGRSAMPLRPDWGV
jgi:cyclopropane-fatty-acyl-phospholipid synthase